MILNGAGLAGTADVTALLGLDSGTSLSGAWFRASEVRA
jgi:hypothetical protein